MCGSVHLFTVLSPSVFVFRHPSCCVPVCVMGGTHVPDVWAPPTHLRKPGTDRALSEAEVCPEQFVYLLCQQPRQKLKRWAASVSRYSSNTADYTDITLSQYIDGTYHFMPPPPPHTPIPSGPLFLNNCFSIVNGAGYLTSPFCIIDCGRPIIVFPPHVWTLRV